MHNLRAVFQPPQSSIVFSFGIFIDCCTIRFELMSILVHCLPFQPHTKSWSSKMCNFNHDKSIIFLPLITKIGVILHATVIQERERVRESLICTARSRQIVTRNATDQNVIAFFGGINVCIFVYFLISFDKRRRRRRRQRQQRFHIHFIFFLTLCVFQIW